MTAQATEQSIEQATEQQDSVWGFLHFAPEIAAKKTIQQHPFSDAPAVPGGTIGTVCDDADGYLWVDFGGAFGVVQCDVREVNPH